MELHEAPSWSSSTEKRYGLESESSDIRRSAVLGLNQVSCNWMMKERYQPILTRVSLERMREDELDLSNEILYRSRYFR